MKVILSIIFLLYPPYLHALEYLDSLPDGLYYIQGNMNPQKNKKNEFILSYRPESDGEIYFQMNNGSMVIYYYQSGYYWVVGRVESSYSTKLSNITVKEIIEARHTPDEKAVIIIGNKFLGNKITQEESELIPISKITESGFVIDCNEYIKENNISAYSFPENYIISAEGGYCNRAYDDSGNLVSLRITVKKINNALFVH